MLFFEMEGKNCDSVPLARFEMNFEMCFKEKTLL